MFDEKEKILKLLRSALELNFNYIVKISNSKCPYYFTRSIPNLRSDGKLNISSLSEKINLKCDLSILIESLKDKDERVLNLSTIYYKYIMNL